MMCAACSKIKDEMDQLNLFEEELCAVVIEVNMVVNNPEWWYDTRATTHIYTDRPMFRTYQVSKTQGVVVHGKQYSLQN